MMEKAVFCLSYEVKNLEDFGQGEEDQGTEVNDNKPHTVHRLRLGVRCVICRFSLIVKVIPVKLRFVELRVQQ